MSVDREERASAILQLCEYAARNLIPDMEDSDDHEIQDIQNAFGSLTSKLRYLLPRSSAAWKKAFEEVLDSSHSMRVEVLQADQKEKRRAFLGTCMACGRKEKNCRYSIDLAGNFDISGMIDSPVDVVKGYADFVEQYDRARDESNIQHARRTKQLPEADNGCFIVGETCLRKAQLRYLLNTLVLDTAYESERILEGMTGSGERLEQSELYTVTDERAEDLVNQQDNIELAIADEKRRVPKLAVDHDFWSVIDNARDAASGGDEDVFNSLIRTRAHSRMQECGLAEDDVEDEEDEYDEEDFEDVSGGDDDEEDSGVKSSDTHRPKRSCARKRKRVVRDDSEDEDEGRRTRSMTRASRPGCSKDPVEPPSRKKRPDSVSGIAGISRAAGSLPSRRAVLQELMELQLKLEKKKEHTDAAVCSHAILTLQELMDRVEELAHTIE
jgi:hypothetical protein